MIPIHLKLSGFLSYHDPMEIDFTSFDLACISGPNGAGKSSILDAITWALFGQARKRDESLINSRPDVKAAEVVFTFEYEGNVYRVQRSLPRGKTTQLEFQIQQSSLTDARDDQPTQTWKTLTERTLRETQARIEQILRLDYDTFINASFFLQGKADLFTQQRPGDRKHILGSILGLEVWDVYRQRTMDRRREVENETNNLQGSLREIETELAQEEARKERLKQLQKELKHLAQARKAQEMVLENMRQTVNLLSVQRQHVDTLSRQVEAAERRLQDLEARLAARTAEREAYAALLERSEFIRAAYAAWQQARDELRRWDEVAARFQDQEKHRQEPLAEINGARLLLEQERQTLTGQQSTVQSQQAEIPLLQEQLEAARQSLHTAEGKLEQRTCLDAELRDAQQCLADAKAENPRLRLEMDELKAQIDRLRQLESPTCPYCGRPLSQEDRLRLIDAMQTQGMEKGDRFRANKTLMEQAEQLVKDLNDQLTALVPVDGEYRARTRLVDQLENRLAQIQALVTTWEQEWSARLVEVSHLLEAESFCPEARLRLVEIDAELKAIGYDAASHDAIRHQEYTGRSAEAEWLELEKSGVAIAALETTITDLAAQRTELATDLTQQQAECQAAALALAEAEEKAPDLETAQRQFFDLQEQENRLRLEVGAAQQEVLVLDDLKKRRKEMEARQAELALLISRYKQLERAFSKDGVPALLIEQALPQIEAKANEILDRLSSGTMSVRFVTQSAYKDKRREDLRETLDIQISDGSGARDYEMYSGGEAFRVNFAIRLALSEVLAQRAGARLRLLVIDEGFGSQDTQGRQRLIEAINLVRQDFSKVLVITHIDELKDAFPARIEIEKTERGSLVRVI